MDLQFDTQFTAPVAGLDEVGRGPLAGPVIACAAIIPNGVAIPDGLDDSKKLSARKREALFAYLTENVHYGLGEASPAEIDQINILQASLLAMQRAFDALSVPPATALVDGNKLPSLPCPAHAIVKGDGTSPAIAAAAIIAKVTRDRIMADLSKTHPEYGWERNAGYPTAQHRQALSQFGATPHHRRSFAPVHKILCPDT